MVKEQFGRTERLLGAEAMERLYRARVAVFGIGGVGGFAVEALARSGIGTLDLIDSDTVCESNLNRQIIATRSALGRSKTEVMRERILDINPEAVVHVYNCFFLPENAGEFPFSEYDYVIDAVDTVTAKLELILRAKEAKTPIISCMGAGNKLDPTGFKVADIYQTKVCPLAKVMRRELKKRGVRELKVVYSEEEPISFVQEETEECREKCVNMENREHGAQNDVREEKQMQWKNVHAEQVTQMDVSLEITRANMPCETMQTDISRESTRSDMPRETAARRSTPGSIAFVPSVAGLILAGEVIKDIAWSRIKKS